MADKVLELGRGQILLGNYLIDAYDVDYTPHTSDYEYFESYEGIIPIRKQLDKFVELKFKTILTEANMPNYKYDPAKGLIDPIDYRQEFVELRKTFLDDLDGSVIVVASNMFKAFKGIISVKKYMIPGGETATEYDIEIKEVN